MASQNDELLGTTEVSLILRVDVRTVARWARRGELAYVRQLPGKRGAFLFARAGVEEFAARRDAAWDAAWEAAHPGHAVPQRHAS